LLKDLVKEFLVGVFVFIDPFPFFFVKKLGSVGLQATFQKLLSDLLEFHLILILIKQKLFQGLILIGVCYLTRHN